MTLQTFLCPPHALLCPVSFNPASRTFVYILMDMPMSNKQLCISVTILACLPPHPATHRRMPAPTRSPPPPPPPRAGGTAPPHGRVQWITIKQVDGGLYRYRCIHNSIRRRNANNALAYRAARHDIVRGVRQYAMYLDGTPFARTDTTTAGVRRATRFRATLPSLPTSAWRSYRCRSVRVCAAPVAIRGIRHFALRDTPDMFSV